jgi:hypothetical protein
MKNCILEPPIVYYSGKKKEKEKRKEKSTILNKREAK